MSVTADLGTQVNANGDEVPAIRLDHATMTVKVHVCNHCWMKAEDIPGIEYGWQTSARATVKFDVREPGVLYVIPHREDCYRLEPLRDQR